MELTSARKLPMRRKRLTWGRPVRISDEVLKLLNPKRRGRSWDDYFRHLFGLPARSGAKQPLVEGMLEVNSGLLFLKTDACTWAELEETAWKTAHLHSLKTPTKRIEPPLRMREAR